MLFTLKIPAHSLYRYSRKFDDFSQNPHVIVNHDKQNIHCMAKANSSSCSGGEHCSEDEFCDVVVGLCESCSICYLNNGIQVAAGCSRCTEQYAFRVSEHEAVTGTMEYAFIPSSTSAQASYNFHIIIGFAAVTVVLALVVIIAFLVIWRKKSSRGVTCCLLQRAHSQVNNVGSGADASTTQATQQTSFMMPASGISPSDDNIDIVPASPSVDEPSLTQHLRCFSQSARCVLTTLWNNNCTSYSYKMKSASDRSDVEQIDGPNNKTCCQHSENQPMLSAITTAAVAAIEQYSDKSVNVFEQPYQSLFQETSLCTYMAKSEFPSTSQCYSSLQLETDKNAASIHLPSSHRHITQRLFDEQHEVGDHCKTKKYDDLYEPRKHADGAGNLTKSTSYHAERRRSSLGDELFKRHDADRLDSNDGHYRTVHACDGIGINFRNTTPTHFSCLPIDLPEAQPSYSSDDESNDYETPVKQLVGNVVPISFPDEVVNKTMESNTCCMEKTNGNASGNGSQGDVSIDLLEKSLLQLSVEEDGIPNDGQSVKEASPPACELSSLNLNLISIIFSWLDGQMWAVEYYADSQTKVTIGVEGISHEEARRQLEAAGFYHTGLVIQLIEPQFTGAIYTQTPRHRRGDIPPQREADVGPRTTTHLHPGERISAGRKEAVLGAAIYDKSQSTSARQLAITVGHLFDKVGDMCYNKDHKTIIGRCVLQLDEIKSSSHGRMLADIAVVRVDADCKIQNVVTVPDPVTGGNNNSVEYQLQLSEAKAAMPVMVRHCDSGAWQSGSVHKDKFTCKLTNGDAIYNAVQIVRSGSVPEKITDEGDSGNLVFSQAESNVESAANSATAAANSRPTLNVCAMVTGVLDLPNGNSFTIACRLSDVLTVIRNAPENAAVFAVASEPALIPNMTGEQVLDFHESFACMKQEDISQLIDSGFEASFIV